MKTKDGDWEGGVWYPKVKNPDGFNKYKKNPEPQKKPITEIEQFKLLDDFDKKKLLFDLGNEIWRESRRIRALKTKFTIFNKAYFGWKWEEDD